MASTNASTPPREWFETVDEVVRHDGSISIQPDLLDREIADGQQVREFRVRLLDVSDNGWVIDRPFARAGEVGLKPGTAVTGVIGQGTTRYAFRSKVRSTGLTNLNDQQRIAVVNLTPPTHVQVVQRRKFFRVETASNDLPPIKVFPIEDLATVADAECNLQFQLRGGEASGPTRPNVGEPLFATAMDISGNGVAIALDAGDRPIVSDASLLWLELSLPTGDYPIGVAVKPVRIDPRGKEIAVGCAFQFLFSKDHQKLVTDEICAFAAHQQRKLLQRNR